MTLDTDELRARDAAARRAAQTIFDRPLVLEAGAGTGKTRTLVARVVVWCLGPGWDRAGEALRAQGGSGRSSPGGSRDSTGVPIERVAIRVLQRVVAITFTEAAAAEMAERIAESFARIARGETVLGVLPELLPSDRDECCARARALTAALDHLVVRTIHAFCRRLLSTYPLEAGLHPGFQVDAEGLMQAEVIRDVIESHLHDAYAEPGDSGFLSLAEHSQGPPEIDAALRALIQAGAMPEDLDPDPFSDEIIDALVARLRGACVSIERIAAGPLARVKGVARTHTLLDSVGASLRALDASPPPARPGSSVSSQRLSTLVERLVELWPKANLAKLGDWAGGVFGARERDALGPRSEELLSPCAELRALIPHLCKLNPELLMLGRRVLRPLLAEVCAQLRSRGVETFNALLRDALQLLQRHREIGERVRDGLDQLLVDEFQDTDQVQCDLIRLLALDGSGARCPGLFIVGDPKQSIYGWRNADLRAYDGFVGEVRGQGGVLYQLSVSFRSVPVILDEVERVIAPVMREHEGVQPAFQPLVPCAGLTGDIGFDGGSRGPVEYWVSWDGRKDPAHSVSAADANRIEAGALARDIVSLHDEHAVPWSEIAVLLRSTGDIETYLGGLRDAGVPFVVDHDRSYYQRREVIEAWALVQCVLEPADHIALVAFLRSAWVGVPDAALIPLWTAGLPKLVTELTGPEPRRLADLDRVVDQALASMPQDIPHLERVRGWDLCLRAALRHLGELRESFQHDAADVMLEKLRTALLPEATEAARYLGRYRLANLERFYSRLLTALETVGGDAHAVLRALRLSISEAEQAEEARPKDAAEDGVLVTTIHQAKGLDFGHVYLMQMHKTSPPAGAAVNDAAVIGGRLEYCLFGAPTPSFVAVEQQRRAVEAAERVRTLYVAMTRAKQRLVLAGRWSGRGRERSVEAAKSYIDLLSHRAVPSPELGELWQAATAPGAWRIRAAQAQWVFPVLGLAPLDQLGTVSRASLSAAQASTIAVHSTRLREARAAAERRSIRRYSGPISEEAHKDLRELLSRRLDASARFAETTPELEHDSAQRIALAAGTAVHRALERFDLGGDPQVGIEVQTQALSTYIPAALVGSERDLAVRRAQATLQRFAAGPLWSRFVSLRAHVVARELPVLLQPLAELGDGPVAVLSGAIDLVCRDPSDGALFIVDYKTDLVSSDEELKERAAAYASQGRLYARALQEALTLQAAPRFELWFIDAGVVR